MGWGSELHTKANGGHNSLYSLLFSACAHTVVISPRLLMAPPLCLDRPCPLTVS